MSAQILDRVIFRDREYGLVGVRGTGLFDPADHGLHLKAPNETCARGYSAEYLVQLGRLMLKSLWLNPLDPDSLPLLLHGAPFNPGLSAYRDCPDPMSFSGRFLMARGLCAEGFPGPGWAPPWLFAEVRELEFDDSWLVGEVDRSDKMEAYRRQAEGQRDEGLQYPDLDEL